MRYRAIVISQNPEFVSRLEAILGETADVELHAAAVDAREAIRESTRETTHLILVDSALTAAPPLDVTREVQSKLPHIAVLLVVPRSNSDLLDEALSAGARNILSLSDSFEDIRSKSVGAAQWAERIQGLQRDTDSLHMGASRVIVFAGAKGGVGTTTMAVHAARSLAADQRKVCLVDLDLTKGDVAHLLDIAPGHDPSALVQLADAPPAQAVNDLLYTMPSGLRVLCAPDEPEHAEEIREELVRDILVTLRQMFEIIIVDAGASITGVLGSALEVSDRTIIVTPPDLIGARGANRLAALNSRLSLCDPESVNTLINRANRKTYLQPPVIAKLVSVAPLPIVLPDQGLDLEAAVNGRDPSLVTDRKFHRTIAQITHLLTQDRAAPASDKPAPQPSGRSGSKRRRLKAVNANEGGAVTVEFMALMPLLLVFVAALLQVVVYAAANFQAGTAAEAAAHACARDDNPLPAAQAEARGSFKDRMTASSCSTRDGMATSEVTVRVHSIVPKWLGGPATVSATGAAVDEP